MAQAPLLSLIFIYGWLGFAGATFFACIGWTIYLFMQPSFTGLLFVVPFVVVPFAFAQIILAMAAYRGSQGARRYTEISAAVVGAGVLFVGGPIMLIVSPGLVLIFDTLGRWPIESLVLLGYPALMALSVMHAFSKDANAYFLSLRERQRAPQPYWHALVILVVMAVAVTVEQVVPHEKTVDTKVQSPTSGPLGR